MGAPPASAAAVVLACGVALCRHLLGAVLLSACAGTLRTRAAASASRAARPPLSARLGRGRTLLLRLTSGSVTARPSVAANGMPQCTFTAQLEAGRVSATVNVDHGPQVQFRLERTVVEAAQLFGPAPPGWHAPIGLSWPRAVRILVCERRQAAGQQRNRPDHGLRDLGARAACRHDQTGACGDRAVHEGRTQAPRQGAYRIPRLELDKRRSRAPTLSS